MLDFNHKDTLIFDLIQEIVCRSNEIIEIFVVKIYKKLRNFAPRKD